MNQKEIQAVRQSLRLIASGETLDARKLLAGLTVSAPKSVRVAAPKPVKTVDCRVCCQPVETDQGLPFYPKAKQSGVTHYACQPWTHPKDCLCLPCRRFRARANKPLTFTGLTKMLPPQNMEQLLGQKQAVRVSAFAVKAKLRQCACGHGSESHIEDELNNLLECKADACGCDHFHYQTDTAVKTPELSRADRIAMETLNADLEAAEDREYGLDAVGE